MIWPLLYGLVAISTAAFLPMTAALQREVLVRQVEFAKARKITEERGLTYEQAVARCKAFNDKRTAAQIRKGTKLEFEREVGPGAR